MLLELILVFIRARRSAQLATAAGRSSVAWISLTVLAWFGAELLAVSVISIPILLVELKFGALPTNALEITLLLFAYLPALLAANWASLRVHAHLRSLEVPSPFASESI